LGKSLLARYVIPALMLKYNRKVVSVYDTNTMNANIDEVLSKKIICIDDVGTEDISVKYGEKRLAFAEVMDNVEKKRCLIIATSNLTMDEILERYGERVLDRIKSTTKRVVFTGKSFR
jgi:DNA replication protein DnaC